MEYRVTISPDPSRIVNVSQKRNFASCNAREQYNRIKDAIKVAVIETQQFENIKIHCWFYFEFNSSANLHCHGIVRLHTANKDLWKYFQRMVFRNLGKVFVKGNINTVIKACCDMVDNSIDWKEMNTTVISEFGNEDIILPKYRSWLEYCLKDQTEQQLKRFPKYELTSECPDSKELDIIQRSLNLTQKS